MATQQYGLKIAKDGFHADSTPNKNLVLNSDLPCLKILQLGKQTISIADNETENYTIALTVPFPVEVFVFVFNTLFNEYQPLYVSDVAQYAIQGTVKFNSSNLYVSIDNYTGGALSSHFYYFICYA